MMRKDRIPDIDAAVAYLTKFNPNFRDPKEIERTILECADFLLNTSADAISTIGFYLKLENYYDHNGDFEIWVSPEMWASTAEAIRDIEAERDEARLLLQEARAERDQLSSGFRGVTRVAKDTLEKMGQAIAERDALREVAKAARKVLAQYEPHEIVDAEADLQAALSRIPAPEGEKG